MNTFNILDRNLALHQHYLVEASAGTGKTFSIQNIVVRLLIEPLSKSQKNEFIDLSKILVVTFTRAATRDLKKRVRSNIEQTIELISYKLETSQTHPDSPDYLLALFEKNDKEIIEAKKRLEHSLYGFDQAQIFTIHSFCARMLKQYALETDLGLNLKSDGENPLPKSELRSIVHDFFKTEIHSHLFSPAQIDILLKNDPNQKELLSAILTIYPMIDLPSFQELFDKCKTALHEMKNEMNLTGATLLKDFEEQARYYKNYKNGITKEEVLNKIIAFTSLFDKTMIEPIDFDRLIKDQLVWVFALDPSLAKKNCPNSFSLHHPGATGALKEKILPLIQQASNYDVLLARFAKACKSHLIRVQNREEKLSPDDFLTKMETASRSLLFAQCVQENFQAAIIDEFQDTDPLQWSIFKNIFLSDQIPWKGHLYLVGDPKQSIYSFRQADIYTYLEAAMAIGMENCRSLSTNYRSQPELVKGMNALLNAEWVPSFIPLPRYQQHLRCDPVHYSLKNNSTLKTDQRGSIHFFCYEKSDELKPREDISESYFFPFISNEILHLLANNDLELNQIAVLVRDKFQGQKLASHFKSCGISFSIQRGQSLLDSAALGCLDEVLNAVLHPRDQSAIKVALGGKWIGWSYDQILSLETLEKPIIIFDEFRSLLFKKGFAFFFRSFMQSREFHEDSSIKEALLARKDGLDLLHDLEQIGDLIIEHQYEEWIHPEEIISFLDRLSIWEDDEDHRIRRFQDSKQEGVKIITLHSSKGLEYEIVFALGLLNRKKTNEHHIPFILHEKKVLVPASLYPDAFLKFCEESDAEKMRQFYVAITRAKQRLYLPLMRRSNLEKLEYGEASPMDLYLAKINQPNLCYESLYQEIINNQSVKIDQLIQYCQNHPITFSFGSKIKAIQDESTDQQSMSHLAKPQLINIEHKPLFIASFTSLAHASTLHASEQLLENSPPSSFDCLEKNEHTLPASADTGLVLHSLLENIPFEKFLQKKCGAETIQLIQPFLFDIRYKGWESVLSSIVYQALKVPIHTTFQSFCLAEIKPDSLYREMPFFFPYESKSQIKEMEQKEGFIKGVIDLIFSINGYYYIVDWKSNWLGPSNLDYTKEKMSIAMKENDYFLQAKIYKEALRRYLGVVELRPFESCFGGILYLFLRGISKDGSTGIYYLPPDLEL